jgi:hypothetical protein
VYVDLEVFSFVLILFLIGFGSGTGVGERILFRFCFIPGCVKIQELQRLKKEPWWAADTDKRGGGLKMEPWREGL